MKTFIRSLSYLEIKRTKNYLKGPSQDIKESHPDSTSVSQNETLNENLRQCV